MSFVLVWSLNMYNKTLESFIYKTETYQIIGLCMEVQNRLGFGFSEIIYKDAQLV